MDRLEAMSIVLEVAEAGSLAGAALDARQRDLPSAADVENPELRAGALRLARARPRHGLRLVFGGRLQARSLYAPQTDLTLSIRRAVPSLADRRAVAHSNGCADRAQIGPRHRKANQKPAQGASLSATAAQNQPTKTDAYGRTRARLGLGQPSAAGTCGSKHVSKSRRCRHRYH